MTVTKAGGPTAVDAGDQVDEPCGSYRVGQPSLQAQPAASAERLRASALHAACASFSPMSISMAPTRLAGISVRTGSHAGATYPSLTRSTPSRTQRLPDLARSI